MTNENHHTAFVDAWTASAARDLPVAKLVDLFDRAFAALWERSYLTLGEITLRAIVNRVLRSGREAFPWLHSIKVEPNGVSFKGLREDSVPLENANHAAALRFLLVELLTVLGNLTGEILTPELHDELSRVAHERRPEGGGGSRRTGAGGAGTTREHDHVE